MKYVFSSLVALGLVASGLGSTTAQADTFSSASNSWPSTARVACLAKKGFTKVAPGIVLLAERRHWISPANAFGMHWALWRHEHQSSATASCERL